MRVLVTGATGRIGWHLTDRLLAEGHTVRAFVLPGDTRAALLAARGVEVAEGHLEDAASLAVAIDDVDAVAHLAGALTSRGNSDEEFFAINLRGTFNLLQAVRERAPQLRRFLYASSDAVYWGGQSGGTRALPVDETHPRLAGTIYGASKIGAEELCLTYWRGFGLPMTIARFGATADASELITPDSVFARWLFLRAAIAHLAGTSAAQPAARDTLETLRRLDTGQEQLIVTVDPDGVPEIRHWGDARDVAAGCLLALTNPAAIGEAFNFGGVAPYATDIFVPYLAERLEMPFVTTRVATARAPWYISNDKARAILGYQPQRTVFAMVDEALAAAPRD